MRINHERQSVKIVKSTSEYSKYVTVECGTELNTMTKKNQHG